ncbi:MAG TPA: hypothetical protein VLF19_07280 [Methylomirabilota bacterium]|nr:hypothetical protein [Methylomirabilota bacterium]
MRLGCAGCLSVVLVMALGAGALWSMAGLFQEPDTPPVAASQEDWVTAQQKLLDLLRRSRGRQAQAVTLSEREVTAVVSRQLTQTSSLPLSGTSVRLLAGGTAEVVGRLPLRVAIAHVPLASALEWLPGGWSRRPVWMIIEVRPRLQSKDAGRRYLTLDVERFAVGRQRLPGVTPRLLLSTASLRYFNVPVPDVVEDVSIERGRLLLRTGTIPPGRPSPPT